jgi:magnesium chelatase family protein
VAPRDAGPELARLPGISIHLADRLDEVLRWLADPEHPGLDSPASAPVQAPVRAGLDLRDVRGHAYGRFALEVAAAGGHHLALIGAPGVGKTMLAERLPGLLDDLGDEESLEVACLSSLAGIPRPDGEYRRPPQQSPHHSASGAAVLGAVHGSRVVPGAVTLAHRGVLILDEAPEFARPALEGLRQSLESGSVRIDRAGWSGRLPARFQLALTANPCPCGRRVGSGAACSCSPAEVRRYASRLSGPLMDRIDLRLNVSRPAQAELTSSATVEPTGVVRDRVAAARERSRHRYRGRPWSTNAELPAGELRRTWCPDDGGLALLEELERKSANLRSPDRVLRVSWTLADLAGRDRPGRDEVAAAAGLRGATAGVFR